MIEWRIVSTSSGGVSMIVVSESDISNSRRPSSAIAVQCKYRTSGLGILFSPLSSFLFSLELSGRKTAFKMWCSVDPKISSGEQMQNPTISTIPNWPWKPENKEPSEGRPLRWKDSLYTTFSGKSDTPSTHVSFRDCRLAVVGVVSRTTEVGCTKCGNAGHCKSGPYKKKNSHCTFKAVNRCRTANVVALVDGAHNLIITVVEAEHIVDTCHV